MAMQLPPGPLSGPSQARNRRRNPFWRFRRFFFVLGIIGVVAIGGLWAFVSQVELLEEDNFDQLFETTYICTGEVSAECGPDNATNEIVRGEDRVIVGYADIPPVLIEAVLATEDSNFFEHKGVDPGGLMRAGYRTGRQKLTGEGSVQGGSTITQQYVKLVTTDLENSYTRKAREIVRAINLEQDLAEELGSTEAAKQQILERYLNRVYFGRGAYGVQAASRRYFDKNLNDLTLPEAAYLAGLLRNPNQGDASERPDEAARRRAETLRQMAEQEYITPEAQAAANADTWPNLIPDKTREGLGEVEGSEYGSEYFVTAVRRQLEDFFPDDQLFREGLRVYTTLDPELQKAAYLTITGRLDPNNPDMPRGALVSVDGNGEVVAMMGGADFSTDQVNLAMGRQGGGSGFQPGSLMKTFTLAEFIEQGFSPDSLYDAPWTLDYPQDAEGKCARWKVSGGVGINRKDPAPSHRTVYHATKWSTNTIYAQMITDVGAEQARDMAQRLGLESEMLGCPSDVLGTNVMSPLEIAGAYANLERAGLRKDPVLIERIEDAQGNVLCWYPTDTCDPDSPRIRQGEQVVDASVARQVNGALEGVMTGTGKSARLLNPEDESVRPAAGKTGTTQNNRDAWFTGFTCGLTTSVWMGYPGVDGEVPRYMNDKANVDNELEVPTMAELFGEEYNNRSGNGDITGGEIPAELWNEFMMQATATAPPCELDTEGPKGDQRVLGLDLQTTLLPCSEPDPALVAAQTTTTIPEQPEVPNPNPDESEEAFGAGQAGQTQQVGFRFAPAENNGGEQPQPTTPPTAPPPTEPCLAVDLDLNVISTTTIDPAAPTTVDPNNNPNDPNNPNPDPNDPNNPNPNPDPNNPNNTQAPDPDNQNGGEGAGEEAVNNGQEQGEGQGQGQGRGNRGNRNRDNNNGTDNDG